MFSPNPPSINTVVNPASGFTQSVTGKKGTNLYVYVRNNSSEWLEASYPDTLSGVTWSKTVSLSFGLNRVQVITSTTNDATANVSNIVSVDIYLNVLTPEVYNIWNHFDEFGLLLGLSRIPGEGNKSYKSRLLDVYINKANSTYSGLLNGIARELGLTPSQITIKKLSDLCDSSSAENILNSDGNALGTALIKYADEVMTHNPIFFGNVISDESYWDCVDEETNGYVFLPHIWDPSAEGIYDKWQSAGIGDQDDLWVNDPISVWNATIGDYSWYLPIHTGYFYSADPSGMFYA